jgi:hypothetical protein
MVAIAPQAPKAIGFTAILEYYHNKYRYIKPLTALMNYKKQKIMC